MWNNFNQPYSYTSPYRSNVYQNPYQFPQNNYQPNMTQSQPQTAQSQNNIVWVKGKENARSMQLNPNSTMMFLDAEKSKFYIKSTDDIGLGRLRTFSYVEEIEEEQEKNSIQNENFVTKQQLQTILKEIRTNNEQLIRRIEQQSTKSSSTANNKQPIIIKKQQ